MSEYEALRNTVVRAVDAAGVSPHYVVEFAAAVRGQERERIAKAFEAMSGRHLKPGDPWQITPHEAARIARSGGAS